MNKKTESSGSELKRASLVLSVPPVKSRTQQSRTQQPRTQQPRRQQPRTQSPRTQRPRLNQAQERTRFLIETLGSGAKLASILRVNRSQPTQWRKRAETPSPDTGRLLVDLDHVVARAAMIWSSDLVMSWLSSPNAFLDGATPADVLRERGSRDVIDALDAEHSGSYA